MSMRWRIAVGLSLLVMMSLAPCAAHAATADVRATYPFLTHGMAANPVLPHVYATMPTSNAVAVIDTRTLQQIATVPVGALPRGLAVSPDGSRVYVGDGGENTVSVIDAATLTTLPKLDIPFQAANVAVGQGNRIYVSPYPEQFNTTNLAQVDVVTNTATQIAAPSYAKDAVLHVNPDRTRLYVANRGLSPSALARFDISGGATPTLLSPTHSGWGGDIGMTHDGAYLAVEHSIIGQGTGYGKVRTSDMTIVGFFPNGDFSTGIAFAPDDTIAYTTHMTNEIEMWDVATTASLGELTIPALPSTMALDRMVLDATGQTLFVAGRIGGSNWNVWAVAVPEPAGALMWMFAAAIALERHRRTAGVCRFGCAEHSAQPNLHG